MSKLLDVLDKIKDGSPIPLGFSVRRPEKLCHLLRPSRIVPLKERAGIPFLKEFGPVAIHELMYTFWGTFLFNLYISSDFRPTVLRAPWTIFNIIADLSFSEWVHFGFKFSLKYFSCASRNLKSRKFLFLCIQLVFYL